MKFEMTPEGFKEAILYLKEINQLETAKHEKSLDGFTVVALANSLFENSSRQE